MANESFANTLLVEVDGSPLAPDVAALLTHAYVDDSRNLPDLFVLRFRDPGHEVIGRAGIRIGAKITLKVQTAEPGGAQPLTSGEVTAVELDLNRAGTMTEVRGLDLAHRLFRGRRVAAYPDMTVADVVRKVAQRAGLQAGTIDATPGVGGGRHTQLSQDNVSDWEFLSRLADLVGAQVAVVDGALEFRVPAAPGGAPPTTAKATSDPLVLQAHRNLVALRATVTAAEQVPAVEARGWDFEHKQAVSATATPAPSGSEVPAADPVGLGNGFASPPLRAADAGWRTPAVVRAVATALAGQVGSACVEVEGVAKGNPKLRAGAAVALAGVGDPFAGRYTLSGTRHLFSEQAGYTTAFTVSGRRDRSLYALTGGSGAGGVSGAGGGGDRPGGGAGLVPAIVSDVRDPLKLGRVRLTLPWLDRDFTTGWARTVQPGAGKGYGALVLPEVGDEVLVGFAGGDVDCPYVLGGLHNGRDTVPRLSGDPVDRASGEITERAFVSRTGHKIELIENGGVLISSGDGKLTVRLDTKRGLVEIKGGRGVSVDAGTGALKLAARTGVTIDGGTGKVEITGQQVSVSGTAATEVTSSGQVTVRGTLIRLN